MKLFLNLLIVFILSFAPISCSRPVKEDEAVKQTVARYNHALMSAYMQGNFGPLTDVAEGEAFSMPDNTYQAYLNGEGIVLDSELLEMKFDKITLGSGEKENRVKVVWSEADKEWKEVNIFKQTFADTTELWKYKWIDAKTGETASPVTMMSYNMTYTLEKKGGAWKIISTKIKSQNVEKQEGDSKKWKLKTGKLAHGK